ncbi:MAG: TonB family protein [Pyrinomonadaceae bacterium]
MLKPRRLLLWFLIAGTAFLFQYWSYAHAVLAQTSSAPGAVERQRGIELYRQNNFSAATQLLKNAVKKNDSDDEAWYYLGLALTHQLKELKSATKAFEKAIKLKPNSAAAHTGLSYVLLRRNKFSEALREAQTALKIEPGVANAHYIVGVVRLSELAFDDALSAANEAIRLNPKLAAAYLLKSESLWGKYVGPLDSPPSKAGTKLASGATPPTPEQLEERRQKRKQGQAILHQSAESLETYLKLNPSDPSMNLWREQLVTLKVISNVGKVDGEIIRHGDEVTTKARVLAKPEPRYTEEARRAQIVGTVVLRVVFSADGIIRHVLVIRGLPFGLNERAIEAARGIRFTPATIDGVPVSMFVQVEYNFYLY